jgi:hypothetical protein
MVVPPPLPPPIKEQPAVPIAPPAPVPVCPTGCARSEPLLRRMRVAGAGAPGAHAMGAPLEDSHALVAPGTQRTAQALDQLPLAMRYRQLRASAARRLHVRRSAIEGLGVWAREDIEVRTPAHACCMYACPR